MCVVCYHSNKDGHMVKTPDKEKMTELQADFRAWERVRLSSSLIHPPPTQFHPPHPHPPAPHPHPAPPTHPAPHPPTQLHHPHPVPPPQLHTHPPSSTPTPPAPPSPPSSTIPTQLHPPPPQLHCPHPTPLLHTPNPSSSHPHWAPPTSIPQLHPPSFTPPQLHPHPHPVPPSHPSSPPPTSTPHPLFFFYFLFALKMAACSNHTSNLPFAFHSPAMCVVVTILSVSVDGCSSNICSIHTICLLSVFQAHRGSLRDPCHRIGVFVAFAPGVHLVSLFLSFFLFLIFKTNHSPFCLCVPRAICSHFRCCPRRQSFLAETCC